MLSAPARRLARRAPALVGSLVLAAGLLAAGPTAHAADDPEALRMRAQALVREGRCEEALSLLARTGETERSARGERLRGQCLIELERYAEAVQALERARELDPALAEVDLDLAVARFHQGDLQGARAALADVEPALHDRPEYQLYRGLLLLQDAESREAATALERARETGPASADPVASYYAGLAWAGADEHERAEEALRRVQQLAPGSPWAEEAERALTEARGGEAGDWWLRGRLGFEYDDNVVLLGDGIPLPDEIASDGDVRGVWRLDGGYELLRTRDWSAGVLASYYGSLHQDLEDFNLQQPTLGFWLDRRLGEATTARLRFDAGYSWFGGDPFLFSMNLQPALHHEWSERHRSRVFANLYRSNYLFSPGPDVPDALAGGACPGGVTVCSPPGVDESEERNRDGEGFEVGFDHSVGVPAIRTELRGGYSYHYFDARGLEYSYQGHELRIGTETALPLDFTLRGYFSYLYKPFRNASTFPDPDDVTAGSAYTLEGGDRREDRYRWEVELERPLTEHLTGLLRYTYSQNNSNVDVFDYEREIAGAYVTFRFGS